MYSVENACLVVALGAALAFPPGFLWSALGVRIWCSFSGEAGRAHPKFPRSLWGSVWACHTSIARLTLSRFVCGCTTEGCSWAQIGHSCACHLTCTCYRWPIWLEGSVHALGPAGPSSYGMFLPPALPSLGCKVCIRVWPSLRPHSIGWFLACSVGVPPAKQDPAHTHSFRAASGKVFGLAALP